MGGGHLIRVVSKSIFNDSVVASVLFINFITPLISVYGLTETFSNPFYQLYTSLKSVSTNHQSHRSPCSSSNLDIGPDTYGRNDTPDSIHWIRKSW